MLARILSTEALALRSARHPWITIGAWLALVAISVLLIGSLLGGGLTAGQDLTGDAESARAHDLISERFPGSNGLTELVIVRSASLTVDEAAYRDFLNRLTRELATLGEEVVTGAANVYLLRDQTLVSADRRTTIVPVLMAGSFDEALDNVEQVHAVVDGVEPGNGFEVFVTGRATTNRDFSELSERDLQTGEKFGVPIAMVILVLVFGALAAALLPVLLAAGSIIVALGATALVGQAFDLSFFVVNMITMMGLAVGIDYSLFIVSRFREQRRLGQPKLAAIGATGATASRTVLFSGIAVVVAMIGLLIVPVTVFRSLATGAILVVVTAVLASLTLLPAVLSLLGDRVNALPIPLIHRLSSQRNGAGGGAFWDRVSRAVMRRPVLSVVLSAGLLIAATVPYFGINTGASGPTTLPEGLRSRDGLLALQREFATGLITPTRIIVDGDTSSAGVQQGIQRLQATLAGDADFGPVHVLSNDAGDAALLTVPLTGDPVGEDAIGAVRRLRADYVPQAFDGAGASVLVGGNTAMNIDFFDVTDQYTPIVFAFVLGASFLILTMVFRSLVVPIKAIVMNLLSVGAAYGLLVLVFQRGVAIDLLGFQRTETIEAWIPLFMFTVLFGLSMDYHVFLLSRIRERFDQTGDNTGSVSFGLRSTAGLITGAAAIMVAVFGGFAAGDLVMFQQIGFGLAVSIILDATLVRTVLVPASMKLLGTRNWYLPKALRWLPDLRPEGASALATVAEPVPVEVEEAR